MSGVGGLIAAALLLAATEVSAQHRPVLGQGNVLCQVWSQDTNGRSDEASARVAWVLGYITAFNQYQAKPEGDVSSGRSTEDITAWINQHCSLHPTDDLYRASAAMVAEFRQTVPR
jgi:hypothetical protein